MKKEEFEFKEELEFFLSNKIFFREPTNIKVLLFSFIYLFATFIGVNFSLYFLINIFTLPLLVYILAAKGKNYFIPIVLSVMACVAIFSSVTDIIWNLIHIFLAIVVYNFIKYRYSKLFILIAISGFIFFAITIYMHILFSISVVNFSSEGIQNFIDNYILQITSLQPETDVDILREAFEQLKRYIPTIIFMTIVGYSLVLINYTFSVLAKEKAIVPVFPSLKFVGIGRSIAHAYIFITLILILIILVDLDSYNPYYLFIDNTYSIFRWLFVFNGICTVFFFVEEKVKTNNVFFKVVIVVSAYLFSSLFDVIGLIDSLMKLREKYVRMRGDK